MNYELFIAKRIIDAKQDKSSISSPIIKIAIIAIALGIIIMMIAVATSVGLKHKIRDMKKFAIISVVVFVFALVLSSCGKENCPAYSKADTNTEVVG